MKARRPITDRLQDRLWTIWSLRCATILPPAAENVGPTGSISGSMDWPKACAALADGRIASGHFRRLHAVMEVVETLGPCDGRHHARLIRMMGHADWLEREDLRSLASWGGPLKWPARLLETPIAYAPTSLRYLSHALWLRDQGMVGEGSRIVEIGVGYGGLAAMNALVSSARTILVDLPEVERSAMAMLAENYLAHAATPSTSHEPCSEIDCVISNYAFTELSSELQDQFIDQYLAGATHGMILSNASVFASKIGGRTDEALLETLKGHGIEARIDSAHPVFSPSDLSCRCALIHW